MGYKYLNQCFETKQDFLDYVAQGCFPNQGGSGGLSSFVIFCASGTDDITVYSFQPSNGSVSSYAYTYTPQLISCEPNNLTNADITALAWMVFGVWAVAWGIKKILDLLSKND